MIRCLGHFLYSKAGSTEAAARNSEVGIAEQATLDSSDGAGRQRCVAFNPAALAVRSVQLRSHRHPRGLQPLSPQLHSCYTAFNRAQSSYALQPSASGRQRAIVYSEMGVEKPVMSPPFGAHHHDPTRPPGASAKCSGCHAVPLDAFGSALEVSPALRAACRASENRRQAGGMAIANGTSVFPFPEPARSLSRPEPARSLSRPVHRIFHEDQS